MAFPFRRPASSLAEIVQRRFRSNVRTESVEIDQQLQPPPTNLHATHRRREGEKAAKKKRTEEKRLVTNKDSSQSLRWRLKPGRKQIDRRRQDQGPASRDDEQRRAAGFHETQWAKGSALQRLGANSDQALGQQSRQGQLAASAAARRTGHFHTRAAATETQEKQIAGTSPGKIERHALSPLSGHCFRTLVPGQRGSPTRDKRRLRCVGERSGVWGSPYAGGG